MSGMFTEENWGRVGEGKLLPSISQEQSFKSINLHNIFTEEQVVQPGCATWENIEKHEKQAGNLNFSA